MISLFPDQEELVSNVREAMKTRKSVLLQSATGSGKTRMAQHIIESAHGKGNGIIFTVPRKQLLEQTSESFEESGIQHSFIAPDKPYNPYARVHIGMIETMSRRIEKLPPARLIIPDEVHYGDKAMDNVITHYKNIGSWILGLSATPWKMNGRGMGRWFDTMVQGKSVKWLIENKRLSDYRYFMGKVELDFSGIGKVGGELNQKQLNSYMEANERAIIGDVVGMYIKYCMGNLHVVRCVSIARSEAMAAAFREMGIPAAHVDGETDRKVLDSILRAYARREILVLCFCDLLTFGFDLSQRTGMDVCVESGSDAKPSESLAGQVQFWGRMLRYKEKPAIIIDHVNNWKKHGFPCDDREWTLEDAPKKKSGSEKAPPTRQCPECFCVHKPEPVCPDCGHVYTAKERMIEEVDGDVVEISKEEMKRIREEQVKKRKQEQGMAGTMDELIELAKSRGYKYPVRWAARIYKARRIKK